MRLIFKVLFTTLGVLVASVLVHGIMVANFWVALLVAIVLGILNVTIGAILKVLTLPLGIVTFGLFFLVINALMFWLASFVKGFEVSGFWAAFFGALVVTIISMCGRILTKEARQDHWY